MQRSLFPRRRNIADDHARVCPRLPLYRCISSVGPDLVYQLECPECGWASTPFVVRSPLRLPE